MRKSLVLVLSMMAVSTAFLNPTEALALGRGVKKSAKGFDLCHEGDKYIIKSGKHSTKGRNALAFYRGRSMSFTACFEKSAQYDLGNANQEDTNKLYGFSDCSSGHQKNSIRIGWLWNKSRNAIEQVAYGYADRQRHMQSLGFMAPGEKGDFQLDAQGDQYLVRFNNNHVYLPRGCGGKGGIKHRLFPYFGGNERAPHDIHIRIDER